jgi:hypothetical protein
VRQSRPNRPFISLTETTLRISFVRWPAPRSQALNLSRQFLLERPQIPDTIISHQGFFVHALLVQFATKVIVKRKRVSKEELDSAVTSALEGDHEQVLQLLLEVGAIPTELSLRRAIVRKSPLLVLLEEYCSRDLEDARRLAECTHTDCTTKQNGYTSCSLCGAWW